MYTAEAIPINNAGSTISHLPRHAGEMHELIDAHVAIARKMRDHIPGRHAALVEELGELLLQRLTAHGCKLPREQIHELLSMDIDLNALGLESWLDHSLASG